MSDWPATTLSLAGNKTIHTSSMDSLLFETTGAAQFTAAAAWPAANLALYIPFIVEQTVTAYKMAFEVGAQAGNYDIGLYSEAGDRLVSTGSTAVPAAGLAVADIADTVLGPGVYFMAINMSTITTLTIERATGTLNLLQAAGMLQQAVGAVTLPNPATFALVAQTYVPGVSVTFSTVI